MSTALPSGDFAKSAETPIYLTSNLRVLKFLDMTRDYNPIHRSPEFIMPGMFYLALAAHSLDNPISSISLSFKDVARYPLDYKLRIDETESGRKFVFENDSKVLCEADIAFGGNPRLYQNQGLEDFAQLLGLGTENQNLRAIWCICLVPGEILRFFGDKPGFYLKQNMKFKGYLPNNLELRIAPDKERTIRGKDMKWIDTSFFYIQDKVIEGEAVVASL
jgi:hypothetical protein